MSKNRHYIKPTIEVKNEVIPIAEDLKVEVEMMFIVKVADGYLKEWHPFTLTNNKSTAIRIPEGVADGYANYIRMCKHKDSSIEPV